MTDLPALAALSALNRAFESGRDAVLIAAPGSGKTTAVPPAFLETAWLGGQKIVMLEPRRMAARAAAARIAAMRGEKVGETVGYRVRLDAKVGPRTRLEVVTEGILTRRLQADPALSGVGLLVFDEFHERGLDADLALALARDSQKGLRPDLRILVMSATIDGAGVAALLGGADVIDVPGRLFPVETHYLGRVSGARLEDEIAGAVRRALRDTDGGILAFLPGEAEIRRTAARLGDLAAEADLFPLYGALPPSEQDKALLPSRRRKIVLATTIAETSLTIEGIAAVVDSGLKRAPKFDPRTGLTRLETIRVSLASADQRRGRAGRLGPGHCYRLWSAAEERAFTPYDAPEILHADLSPLVLDCAAWGVSDPLVLDWRDPPPRSALAAARELLRSLGAIGNDDHLSPMGRAMADLPLHPRLAHMVLAGKARGCGALACDLAALLSERDLLMGTREIDLGLRWSALRAPGPNVHRAARERALGASRQLQRLARIGEEAEPSRNDIGGLVALAYPDRIAQARGGRGRYRVSGGGGALVDQADPLAAEPFLALATTDGTATEARVFLAAPLDRATLETHFGDAIENEEVVTFDERAGAVLARRLVRLGALVLDDKPLAAPAGDRIAAALLSGLRQRGLGALPWSERAQALRARVAFVAAALPEEDWPDLSNDALTSSLDTWLLPWLDGFTRLSAIDARLLDSALQSRLAPPQLKRLESLAPERLALPSGATAAIDYDAPGGPTLRARLQEMFGLTVTPRLAANRVPLRIELLSPAGRPVAITQDIGGFWTAGYRDVRADLRGRYPKHAWPDDPATAPPARPGRAR